MEPSIIMPATIRNLSLSLRSKNHTALFQCVGNKPLMKKVFWGVFFMLTLLGCESKSNIDHPSNLVPTGTTIGLMETTEYYPIPTGTPSPSMPPTEKPAASPSSTLIPTETPTITLTPTETATPTDLPQRVVLYPLNHQWQSLNNCHRASIATLMGYYDIWFAQHDYDVAMDNLADFLVPYGLTARIYDVRYAVVPTHDAVRWLLAEGIPVIVGQNLSSDDHTWHYRVAYGYDDSTGEILSDDPLLGPGLQHAYERFDQLSKTRGQVIPVYPLALDEMIEATMRNWQMKLIAYP
jgi:hypothetical protein